MATKERRPWVNKIVRYGEEDPAQLLANPFNFRVHPKAQQDALDGVISDVGFIDPVIVNETTQHVVNGHLRVSMAISRGEKSIPVTYVNLTEAEEKEALATFDPLGAMAVADKEQLDALLREVQSGEAAVQQMLADLAEKSGLQYGQQPVDAPDAQIDKAAELQEKWQTATGQLWQIGQHRILCGDCREPESWDRLLSGVKVNGIFTSPPYAEQRKEQYGGTPADEYVAWWDAVQANVKAHLVQDGSFFVNIKEHCEDGERVLYVFDLVLAMKRQWRWKYVDELCWVNPGIPGYYPNRFKDGWERVYQFTQVAESKFRPDHVKQESSDCFTGEGGMPGRGAGTSYMGQKGPRKTGMALPDNVIATGSGDGGHAAAFPVALPSFFIRAYSDIGDTWLDPFCGSATTIVAAEQNKRCGMGIELLPKYVAVALERLSLMGLEPVLV